MLTSIWILAALTLADDLLHGLSTYVCRWRTVLDAESWLDVEQAATVHRGAE